jgi:hypothetical protein
MPLQNRVDPFGNIHAVTERGLFTGNRGIIHNPDTKTLLKKRWALQAWIICVCEFRGRRREPMGRNRPGGPNEKGLAGWTELFFLDEVTALAAGHRPCFFCQRQRAQEFVSRFGTAFGVVEPRAPQIDKRLHRERLASGGSAATVDATTLPHLPDGTMIAVNDKPYALRGGKALAWRFAGYGAPIDLASADLSRPVLLTPPTILSILAEGFQPVWHPSATT